MVSLEQASWAHIDAVRSHVMARKASIEEAAQAFSRIFATSFEGIVLARTFLVLPDEKLPPREQAAASALGAGRVTAKTPVLSLVGTHGRRADWCDRRKSRGHLAIPLLDAASVRQAPMIARLLTDLEVEIPNLDTGRSLATRRMLGGLNGTFYVDDAAKAVDAAGRFVIPARDFVTSEKVHTVFGMGGAYVDGTLVVCVIFTDRILDRLVVDRFPSLISNFKMATSALLNEGAIYAAPPSSGGR